MKVFITMTGLRCPKRAYHKIADLGRREAQHLKKSGSINVNKACAEILIDRGWVTDDPNHPACVYRGGVVGTPPDLVNQELKVERTTETATPPPEPPAEDEPETDEEDVVPETDKPPDEAPEDSEDENEQEAE